MKTLFLAVIAMTWLFFPGMREIYADTIGLHKGVLVYDGASPLEVDDDGAPTVVDWNNDGKKDLVVGGKAGKVWIFLNQGTDADPSFNGGANIESNGAPIQVTYG